MTDSTAYAAFCDPRVFVVPHDESGAVAPLDSVFTTQGESGPTNIHVGVNCTDEQLQALWDARKRYPTITLEQLKRARDGEPSMVEVAT